MKMKNDKEREIWMNNYMSKGYSFSYIKGLVNSEKINIAVKCIEANEIFNFIWDDANE